MASIPLPALQIKPQEQPDLLGAAARIGELKSQQQQQQLQGQAIQEGQMNLESQKALMKAYTEANGDLEKALPLAAKYGAKPQDLIKLKVASIQQQQANLELLAKKGDRAVQEANLMQGAHDTVMNAGPADRPRVYGEQIQGLKNAGVDTSNAPPEYPGDQAFSVMGVGLKSHSQQLEELAKKTGIAKEQAQTGEAVQKTAESKANTDVKNLELKYGGTPPMQESRYRAVLQKIQSKLPVSADDMAFAASYEASNAKTTSSSDSLGVLTTNTSKPAGLATIKGPGKATGGGQAPAQSTKNSIVDLIGQYRTDPATISRMFLKHPEILGLVQQKYPDFDQTTYVAKNKLIQSMTSGSQSKEINAINTAMGHLKNLDDAVDALHNGDITVLNKVATAYNINIAGKTPEAAFQLIARRVGPEITSAYIPGAGGEAERIANQKDFDVNLPPQTLHNNAAITVKMLRSKIGSLENQYKNTVGRDDFTQRFITPEAQAALSKLSPQGGAAPTQAAPAKSSLQVGQTVKLKNGNTVKIKAVHADGSFDAD